MFQCSNHSVHVTGPQIHLHQETHSANLGTGHRRIQNESALLLKAFVDCETTNQRRDSPTEVLEVFMLDCVGHRKLSLKTQRNLFLK